MRFEISDVERPRKQSVLVFGASCPKDCEEKVGLTPRLSKLLSLVNKERTLTVLFTQYPGCHGVYRRYSAIQAGVGAPTF
eukprot:m.229580 g.229580  ORF g.229580 m.229580 type:complete len:80 (+) comp40047_c0_seq5:68-307(+)